MKVLILTLLFLPLLLMSMVSSNPNSGVARGNRDQRQASGRRLLKGSQECECKDWFLRASKKKPMTAAGLPKKRCPCDHSTVSVKKTNRIFHGRLLCPWVWPTQVSVNLLTVDIMKILSPLKPDPLPHLNSFSSIKGVSRALALSLPVDP
ncbi:C-X-C motif chemokine 17 isoform X1 [Marmota monax]|uniref:C-X-C motif chemokine 17 isoform X1 n=1 Tax=Marmota monax TaxID=9995 RepID=UPI0026EA2CD5|nr:C-X-C motif chemokine 17 isoform X1 [Marmota monax]